MNSKKQKKQARRTMEKYIVISDEEHGLPYSKGLTASSIMATGLAPSKAYKVARLVEDYFRERKTFSISVDKLREVTAKIIKETAGKDYAEKYLHWQALAKLDKPLIILVGGTTGVGKSTIATEIAHRLGITRIVSTDAIREVMRTVFSKELMPALYDSTFNAWKALWVPLPAGTDPVIVGFREQTAAVSVGIKAVINRSINEGLNVVIEGAHMVPGFISGSEAFGDAFIVPMVIAVEDENLHRSHFYIRELETEGSRPFEKYRANFDSIRKIGTYIEDLAREKEIPVISSGNLDVTISDVLEEISKTVFASMKRKTTRASRK